MRITSFVAIFVLIVVALVITSMFFTSVASKLSMLENQTKSFLEEQNASGEWVSWYRENVEKPVVDFIMKVAVLCIAATFVVLMVFAFEVICLGR